MNFQTIKEKYNKIDGTMYGKRNLEDSVALLYNENSKWNHHITRQLEGERFQMFSSPYIIKRCTQPYKCYPGRETIDLNNYVGLSPRVDLFDVSTRRRSIRTYDAGYKLSLNELTQILYNSYGVTKKSPFKGAEMEGTLGLRNVPSAGGLFPLEVYVVIFDAHIENGLYHYRPDINMLEKMKAGDFMEDLLKIIQAEPYVNMRNASALIITTGLIERLMIKYGERSYRFMLQESGFVGQMISLTAEALNLGTCMLGGYNDDLVNNFLGCDGVFETINNVITLGKAKTQNSCDNESYQY